MILDLREYDYFPAEARLQAGPGQFQPFADCVVKVAGVVVQLAIQHSGQEYFCQGDVKTEVVLVCARCLSEFTSHLSTDTDFVIGSDVVETQTDIPDDEEYVFLSGNDLRADISEPVRQAMVLSLPMMPLCANDCRGLCLVCGANRNQVQCGCKEENIDSRWEGLKDLLPGEE